MSAGHDTLGGRVELNLLSKRFGSVEAVGGVSADIPARTFFSLLGPSGCGKSTLLRLIAGLEEPTSGRVLIDGVDVTAVPPQRRPTAMVFQSYALFPSMTVAENVDYGLKVRRVSKSERAIRVQQALDRVDLSHLGSRPVTQLSGGQQQRVALARALVVAPKVMLFDEPLSNLDVALREKTRSEIRSLQQTLGTTSIYVTHDQQEAMAVSDQIAVMKAGRIVQTGPPEVLYNEPETAYVARFLGGSNIIQDSGLASRIAGQTPRPGLVLSIRPESLVPHPEGPIRGRVISRQFLGARVEWTVECDSSRLKVTLPAARGLEENPRLVAESWRWVTDDL
jgi:ABC-type Fe3+/spermidine/putrescine transport system ATPase subunit